MQTVIIVLFQQCIALINATIFLSRYINRGNISPSVNQNSDTTTQNSSFHLLPDCKLNYIAVDAWYCCLLRVLCGSILVASRLDAAVEINPPSVQSSLDPSTNPVEAPTSTLF